MTDQNKLTDEQAAEAATRMIFATKNLHVSMMAHKFVTPEKCLDAMLERKEEIGSEPLLGSSDAPKHAQSVSGVAAIGAEIAARAANAISGKDSSIAYTPHDEHESITPLPVSKQILKSPACAITKI